MAVVTLHLINDDGGPKTLKSRATDVYQLQAYIFPKAGNAGGGTVALALNCTDSRGVNGPTTVTAKSETVPATGSWSQINGFATVPTGYDTVDPVLTLTSVPVTDQVYVDDALVRESTYAQQIMSTVFGTGTLPASGAAAIPPANVAPSLDGASILADVQNLATNLWGSLTGGSQSGALQNIADAMHQITFGGGATNTALDVASLKAMFGAQPASTVVPPPNPLAAGGITRGATATGVSAQSASGHSVATTTTITPAATDNYVVVPVVWNAIYGSYGVGAVSRTIVFGQSGGQNVTLGTITGPVFIGNAANGGAMYAEVFGGFITPGTTTQTIGLNASVGLSGMAANFIMGYASTYSGVQSVLYSNQNSASTGTPATSGVVSAANDMVVQTYVDAYTSSVGLSALTGATARFTSGAVQSTVIGEYLSMISGDQVGAASMTFGATTSNAFGTYVGMTVQLIGATTTPISAVFNAVNTSTSALSIATANAWAAFPSNSFPTTTGQLNSSSSLFTYNSTSNTVTVLNAGTYLVSVGAMLYSLFTAQRVGVGVMKNGSIYRGGLVEYTSNQSTGAQNTRHITVPVYCNAGDTLAPAAMTSIATTVFQGEATASATYFSVALMSRSLL